MAEALSRFRISVTNTPILKAYHLLSVAVILSLIWLVPIRWFYQIGLALLTLVYGWFAWPVSKLLSFDARLNHQQGHLTLKSAIHLFVGWRLQFHGGEGRSVVWVFDAQLGADEQRRLRVACHLEQMRRQRSM